MQIKLHRKLNTSQSNLSKKIILIVFLLSSLTSFGQIIRSQSFDAGVSGYADDLNYTTSGTVAVTNDSSESAPNSFRMNSNGAFVLFDDINITTYTNVTATISFSSINANNNRDLFLDVSYNNGTSWASTKLIDGQNGGGGEDWPWGTSDNDGGAVATNPYTVNILNTENTVRLRLRAINASGTRFFYVDNIIIQGTLITTCSGTPTGGVVTVSPVSGTPGSTYNVTATGFTSGSGLTYQWQYSDTGGAPWSNQGTATSTYAALTSMVAPASGVVRTWRLVVTCTASASNTNSTTGTFTSSSSTTNDDCAGAIALTPNIACTYTTYTNQNATDSSVSDPGCADYNGGDVWFSILVPASGQLTIDTQTDVITDGGMAVYSGACGSLALIECDDDDSANGLMPSITRSDFVPLSTIYVRVWEYGNNNNGDFGICVTTPASITNDDCVGATSLTVNPTETCTTSTSGTTVDATQSTAGITCNGFTGDSSDDVWYSFIATDANHDITVTPGTLGDFVIDLRSGACNGTTINCADAVASGNEIINASGLSIGTTYYVRIYSYTTTGDEGTFDICITSPGCTALSTSDETRLYFVENEFIGTLNDVTNTSTFSSSPLGYQDFTGLTNSIQAQGEGMNIFVEAVSRGHIKAWVDWDSDGSFNDATEIVFDSGSIATSSTTFGFIIPSSQPIGNYNIRIRIYNSFDGSDEQYGYNFNACENFDTLGSYTEYGETEDYSFTVVESCPAIITSITENENCGPGQVILTATGSVGTTQYHWYANEIDVMPIATTAMGIYTTLSINTTTDFYVTADNGSCESLVRTKITASIKPIPTLTFTPTIPEVCGEDDILELTASASSEVAYLIDEDFEGAGLGIFTNNNIVDNGAVENTRKIWQQRTSVFIPSEEVWFPAISSGFGTNKFVMATSDTQESGPPPFPGAPIITNNALQSPSLDSSNYIDLTLNFDIYFSRYLSSITENVNIEVSTNGGTNWTSIAFYDDDVGYGTDFSSISLNMNAYINEPDLKIRIRYYTDNWCDGVAVDNIQLFGSIPLSSSFSWTPTTINAFLDEDATIPYISGTTASTVYVKPTTAQLKTPSFSFTATVTLSNGCDISENVSVTNNTKYWDGPGIVNWEDPSRWLPNGVPTADNCIIIPDETIISGTSFNAYARNLTIKNTGDLQIESGNSLTVTEWIHVDTNGVFNISDSASLLQIDNDANTGEVRILRNSQPMYRYDYTYWASPLTSASGYLLDDLSPNTLADKFYSWIPTVSGGHGDWTGENPNTTVMSPTLGYAIRGPQNFSTNSAIKTVFPALFVGTPNNGDILAPISVGTDNTLGVTIGNTAVTADDDQWNLLGNPYPSAIDILSFLNETGNDVLLDGTAYLWTHNTPPNSGTPDPFYADYFSNYTSNDYASVNSMGTTNTTAATGGTPPTQYFASGQGFFVLGLGNGSAVFKNDMRVQSGNDNFFKTSNAKNSSSTFTNFEKHRIWLNLSNNSGAFSQILFGYAQGATLGWDRGKDGLSYGGNDVNFYSTAPDLKLTIQAKPLPFTTSDIVPLGFEALNQGQYRIGIDHFDTLFINQPIFLNDKDLNIVHSLNSSPYTFNTNVGTFDNRFEIIYTNQTLSTEEYAVDSNDIKVVSGNDLKVISESKNIKSIEVYDILGKRLMTYNNVDENTILLKGIKKSNVALMLKITFNDHTIVYKKALY
ncbi:GEVED domain-containing protein [Lacinutrix jangbogonensis]|uniref:GEVED domain-containing protein n=1 Tax=Lacinutrix jangbogonensis TaxID=1469557 RepID=UPI00053E0207|nr:GEVED domain-containing protein [Lacinutrix jangbogonensis]